MEGMGVITFPRGMNFKSDAYKRQFQLTSTFVSVPRTILKGSSLVGFFTGDAAGNDVTRRVSLYY